MTDELSALLARIVVPSDGGDVELRCEEQLVGRVVVGRFSLLGVLGRGGFGIVFEALDEQLGRRVAFKVLLARNPNRDELLRREARVVAGFQHPNIVTLYDAGRAEGSWYLVLELLRGETLAARLGRGHLPVQDAVKIASAIAAGLQHAHAAGVLHRDLKPANVFLTIDGGVKVLDFGLSRAHGAVSPAGGTKGYLAPEQRRGEEEDPRTDLFALGVVLAEMTTPRDAWRPRVTDGIPEVDANAAPQSLQSIISRWTSADAARRPRSAAAAIAELREVVSVLEPPDASNRARAVEAALQLGRAEARAAQPLFGQECAAEYRKALAKDPTLAVAHYQLAIWMRRFGGTANEQRTSAKAALRYIANAPPLHRALIRAFVAQLDGRVEQATRMLRDAADAFPDDARASYELADLLRHEDELELCLPWLRRTLSLQPDHGWALGQLAEVLGALEEKDELRSRLAQWEKERSTLALHAVSIARGWLGDLGGAEEAAARALALGGGLVAQLDHMGALLMLERYAEVEQAAAALAAPASPVRRFGYYAIAALHAYQGRYADGWAALDELLREVPGAKRDVHCRGVRVDYLLGGEDREAVIREVSTICRIDADAAAAHAPALAWLGATVEAREVGARLRPGSMPRRLLDAVVTFIERDQQAGLRQLEVVAADAAVAAWRVAPIWLLGDLAARAGREDLSRKAFKRFEAMYLPRVMWRSWAHARAKAGSVAAARHGDLVVSPTGSTR